MTYRSNDPQDWPNDSRTYRIEFDPDTDFGHYYMLDDENALIFDDLDDLNEAQRAELLSLYNNYADMTWEIAWPRIQNLA